MNFEKMRQQHARGIGQMGTGAALDLRKVGLADAFAHLLLHRAHHLLLGQRPAVTAQRAFHLAQVADFLAQSHIANRNSNIAICNSGQELDFPYFQWIAAWSAAASPRKTRAASGMEELAPRLFGGAAGLATSSNKK